MVNGVLRLTCMAQDSKLAPFPPNTRTHTHTHTHTHTKGPGETEPGSFCHSGEEHIFSHTSRDPDRNCQSLARYSTRDSTTHTFTSFQPLKLKCAHTHTHTHTHTDTFSNKVQSISFSSALTMAVTTGEILTCDTAGRTQGHTHKHTHT